MESSGCIVPAREAAVPLVAPGVLFGESLFETIRVRRGRMFRLSDHLARLQRGIEVLAWGTAVSAMRLQEGLRALLHTDELGAVDDLRVRITVLRLDDDGALAYFIHALPYVPAAPEHYREGVNAVVTTLRVDATAPWANLKTGHRLAHRLAGIEARRAGAWEGIMLNADGMLVDGTISNLHVVVDDRILTPSPRCGALPGITQRAVRELAEQRHLPWEPGAYAPTILERATEAFLTNALIGVMPLVRIDGREVGSGRPGPITQALAAAYADLVAQESRPVGSQAPAR